MRICRASIDVDNEVDECARNNGGCPVHSTCVNTPGSFYCSCDYGYRVDGSQCVGALPISAQSTARVCGNEK